MKSISISTGLILKLFHCYRFSGVVPRSFEKKLAKKGSDTYFYGGDMFRHVRVNFFLRIIFTQILYFNMKNKINKVNKIEQMGLILCD